MRMLIISKIILHCPYNVNVGYMLFTFL